MASIEKATTSKGDVRYRVRWWSNGRRVEKWLPTMRAARELKARIETEQADGQAVDPRTGAQVLRGYFEEWIETRLVRGAPLKPGTKYGYQRLWRRTIDDPLGDRRLRDLRPDAIRAWHAATTSSYGQREAAKAYRLLHAVLATAESEELIRANPCRIRGAGQERRDERPLPTTELVLELAAAIEPPYRALVLLVGFASLRTGEVLGLRRLDVNLLHGTVSVVGQVQEVAFVGRIRLDPKNAAGKRTVAIPKLLSEALDWHLANITPPEPEAPVFVGPTGVPLPRHTLSTAWRAAKVATGAPEGLRLYDLRHHAATLTARMPGVTTKELMARIGHSSFRAALIYQHASEERDRAIATFLDDQIAAAVAPDPGRPPGVQSSSRGAGGGLEPDAPSSPRLF